MLQRWILRVCSAEPPPFMQTLLCWVHLGQLAMLQAALRCSLLRPDTMRQATTRRRLPFALGWLPTHSLTCSGSCCQLLFNALTPRPLVHSAAGGGA